MANLLFVSILLSALEPTVSWQQVNDEGIDEKLNGMDIKNRDIYVTGVSYSSDSNIVVMVLCDSGSEKWLNLYGEPHKYEIGEDVAVLSSGNIAVTGWHESFPYAGWHTIWLDSLGEELYKNAMPTDPNGFTYNATSVVAGKVDTSFVGGWYGKPDWKGIRVAKYNPQGERMWRKFFDGEGYDKRVTLTLDVEGSVYALCETRCTWTGWFSDGNTLSFIEEYNNMGAEGSAIRINSADHVFIAGDISQADRDFMLLKYNTDGNMLWPAHKAYDLGAEEECRDMALDAVSDCYLAGYQVSGEEENAAVVKTDSAGNMLWSWVNVAEGKQEIEAVEVDEEGFIYLAGSHHNGEDWDMMVMKLKQPLLVTGRVTDSAGKAMENVTVSVTGVTTLEVFTDTGGYYGIEVCNGTYTVAHDLPVWSFEPSSYEYSPLAHRMLGQDFSDGRYGSVQETDEIISFGFKLSPRTVSFSLPEASNVNLVLYDATGRMVRVLARGLYTEGNHHVLLPELVPGVYFVKINAGDFAETNKVVITR
ncbi:T9SS type A sorting domain-containing protein [candidate division WOR-3 bacterium]|uniref:T9SS type A sorting domain-containing protein n=1 Tax=candidate division WOR-3 bacterium TaxID=2052148 RepID=A0A9D5QCS9_UNCW3|nr:T9SS type A sorting domain-containing protein [candidate division WOR-3 bacterium]MBD3364889.1 T9SS type A sorting domain-containing protein [candidate division WOR-3 bacterium]